MNDRLKGGCGGNAGKAEGLVAFSGGQRPSVWRHDPAGLRPYRAFSLVRFLSQGVALC